MENRDRAELIKINQFLNNKLLIPFINNNRKTRMSRGNPPNINQKVIIIFLIKLFNAFFSNDYKINKKWINPE